MSAQFFDNDHDSDTPLRTAGVFLSGLGLGALLGAAVALLYAPEAGEITRHRLRRRFRTLRHEAQDEWRDVKRGARRELQRRLGRES